ncbi:DUF6379 domain-containing protein [Actinotalea sp. M2MS4P-6]|uniref:C-glycoside deglycosidase beta subunit domain-containing protein n=1 Tax=Actinotalea sp. M2MS4P-6 TaxID=2983762 RepID=UPI0021E452D4|nr:DUF6379 domain-containing protein [Actinotalea sp. M2MS4P-6]MCV2394382.1 DUF6379 domain-containing protein [Actinotalea sp. M2MS4P-6]
MTSVTDRLISPGDAVVAAADRTLVPVRVPWYRSLPLSCWESVAVTLDGQRFGVDQLELRLGDATIPCTELAAKHETFWFVQDTGWLVVPATLDATQVELRVEAEIRIPYILIGPDKALVRHVQDGGTLPVVRSGEQ